MHLLLREETGPEIMVVVRAVKLVPILHDCAYKTVLASGFPTLLEQSKRGFLSPGLLESFVCEPSTNCVPVLCMFRIAEFTRVVLF